MNTKEAWAIAEAEVEAERAKWFRIHRVGWGRDYELEPHEEDDRGETAQQLWDRVSNAASRWNRIDIARPPIGSIIYHMRAALELGDAKAVRALVDLLAETRAGNAEARAAVREAVKKAEGSRSCECCGATIPATTHRRRRFCSDTCRVTAHRLKKVTDAR